MLGSYDYEGNIIRLHPALDVDWAPRYVLETLIYHEILHWLFRPRHDGERRVLHGRAFHEAERAHPYYEKTNTWIEKNLPRLLKSSSWPCCN
jgi:predicted metal-dependent hydrolase